MPVASDLVNFEGNGMNQPLLWSERIMETSLANTNFMYYGMMNTGRVACTEFPMSG